MLTRCGTRGHYLQAKRNPIKGHCHSLNRSIPFPSDFPDTFQQQLELFHEKQLLQIHILDQMIKSAVSLSWDLNLF